MDKFMITRNIFREDYADKTAALYDSKRQIQEAIKDRVDNTMEEVVRALKEEPDAAIVINDLATASGINRSAIRRWVENHRYGSGVVMINTYKTRRMAEVDEEGRLIPGGKTYNQSIRCSVIRCR